MSVEEVKLLPKTTEGPRWLGCRMVDPQRFDGHSERDLLYTMDQQVRLERSQNTECKNSAQEKQNLIKPILNDHNY